ncbi:hypothetical protein BU25DRAFT_416664 [Macroventuria anomochaeta]|uniref:Uncharacterized protein n=1 Tax=Macroventuria anomochaeta TaxID=301207 RepID=A0ACB6SHI5_9PLEO|nr:uncharacterized protein BU25DRAFT_416664 [Macroventuria anomochaeta]KAF2633453.1 hypothetical protein BU25DRAFT_416664 [Macroventuria anomochaeta]
MSLFNMTPRPQDDSQFASISYNGDYTQSRRCGAGKNGSATPERPHRLGAPTTFSQLGSSAQHHLLLDTQCLKCHLKRLVQQILGTQRHVPIPHNNILKGIAHMSHQSPFFELGQQELANPFYDSITDTLRENLDLGIVPRHMDIAETILGALQHGVKRPPLRAMREQSDEDSVDRDRRCTENIAYTTSSLVIQPEDL